MAISDELLDQLLANYKKPEDLVGEGGLLKELTKRLVERAMQTEMTDHLMLNTTLDWQATDDIGLFLSSETRQKRYRTWDAASQTEQYYKDYTILHLGGSYRLAENITLNGRINNLLDKDFNTYDTAFTWDAPNNQYTVVKTDHYNNKEAPRSYWVSMNVTF